MKLTHGGDIYTYKERFKREALDYSANINPLGMPRGVKEALIDSIDSWINYPDPLCRELKSDLADNENVDNEYIILGNGAADIIFRLVYALKPKKAIVLAPTFSEYEEALVSARADAINEMIERAKKVGANGLVGIKVDVESITVGEKGQMMIMVVATGTAVVIE